MKQYAYICLFVAIIIIILPFIAFSKNNSDKTETESPEDISAFDDETMKLLMTEKNEVVELSLYDYVCGSVAAEMPAVYNIEALKAQSIACYTYAVKKKADYLNNPTDEWEGAYLTDSPAIHQAYTTIEVLKEKWGDSFEKYYSKIEQAVKSVYGKVLTYNGEIITPIYHAISSGVTENASDVWGGSVPYLVSVSSQGDKFSPNYSSTVEYSEKEFKEKLSSVEGISFPKDPAKWISDIKTSDTGGVTSLKIGGVTFLGTEIRQIYSVKSTHFTLSYKNEKFIFVCVGYGHGVGLSQYGANYMAENGSNYIDILTHYYSGITIDNYQK